MTNGEKNRAMLRMELTLEYLPPSFKLAGYYLSLLQKEIFLPKVKNLLHQNQLEKRKLKSKIREDCIIILSARAELSKLIISFLLLLKKAINR